MTKDLESLQIDEINAEAMKLKHASALTDEKDIDADATLPIGDGRTIRSCMFIQVVEARMLEIVENVKYLVPHEFADKLLGGIVLTGGGSNMKNIEKLFLKCSTWRRCASRSLPHSTSTRRTPT